ncbi:MAG: transglutaminase domain-containing protein, partial [Planctomycetota bacterium]
MKMTAGKIACYVLVLCALVSMALCTREWLLIGPLVAALVASFFIHLEGDIPFRTYILLGIPFAVLARVHEVLPLGDDDLGLNVPFYVALYMQVVAIRKLASSTTNLAHVIFCATSAVATIGANMEKEVYRAISFALVVPLVLATRGALRRRAKAPDDKPASGVRGVGVAVAALLVFALGEGSARFVEAIYEDVSQAFIRRVARVPLPSAGGFSGAARLGSVADLQGGTEASTIAVRAFSKTAPGYLRGKTFLDYEKGEWTAEPDGPNERPIQLSSDSKLGRLVLPGRKAPASGETPAMRISPSSDFGRYFFLPLRASAIETVSEVVKVAPGGALESPFDPTSSGYGVFTSREPVKGTGWTKLPKDVELLAQLDRILGEIGPREDAPSLVQAIRDWVSAHYTYKYGIDFEKGSDPLVQFLTKKKHGHCELFAATGALLLRRRGVPARYTTGYLCEEKNARSDDLWVARNRHAHAWVEFFHPVQGWEVAEFTPDTGMPLFTPATGLEAWLDALSGWWDRVKALVAEQGVAGLFQAALKGVGSWLVGSWPGR